ncbi:ThiF family adenylyltransferase [Candidatus Pacearchaeota archaeon]|jgi:molybdopterin/thiamine biosynthesis adenylyltransferase|nr:ThiF family adenylyltransferase [Candidatus Pacearchaeota archaeon]
MSKRAVIVGVGALGSHVAQLLRNVADLRLVDFDRIETRNILSQFHAKTNIGRAKAISLQQTMNFLFGTKVSIICNKLVENNAEQLLGEVDLIIDCLDNAEARRIVQNYARKEKVPCLHGGLAADGQFGISIWDENYEIQDGPVGAPTCENGDQLPFIAVVSSYITISAQEFLVRNKRYGFMISPQNATRV